MDCVRTYGELEAVAYQGLLLIDGAPLYECKGESHTLAGSVITEDAGRVRWVNAQETGHH